MATTYDLITVGGGIGGASLAGAMAVDGGRLINLACAYHSTWVCCLFLMMFMMLPGGTAIFGTTPRMKEHNSAQLYSRKESHERLNFDLIWKLVSPSLLPAGTILACTFDPSGKSETGVLIIN
jgi:hypothetical protein